MDMSGKVVLITGAASGMGRLAAKNLAQAGACVAALDLNEEGLQETRAHSPLIHIWVCDVTRIEIVERVVREVETALGPIDRVYNAAGIMPSALILNQPVELIQRIMLINYFGVVNIAKTTLPGMIERGRGELINFASMAGLMPTPYLGAYDASKSAVIAFSEVLFHENRSKGIRIVCVCPPAVATPLLDQCKDAWPKAMDFSPPIAPQTVLDAIEKCLKKGRFWCFPGPFTRITWYLRRFIPGIIWRVLHLIEKMP